MASYVALWLRTSLSRAWGWGDTISSAIGALVPIGIHFFPQWERQVNGALWQLPIYALATTAAFRLVFFAHYELWKSQKDRADVAESQLLLGRNPKHAELEVWARQHMDPIFQLALDAFLECNKRAEWSDELKYSQEAGWRLAMSSPSDEIALERSFEEAQRTLAGYLNTVYLECAMRIHGSGAALWDLASYRVWRSANAKFMPTVRLLILQPGMPVLHKRVAHDWGVRQIDEFWPKEPISTV